MNLFIELDGNCATINSDKGERVVISDYGFCLQVYVGKARFGIGKAMHGETRAEQIAKAKAAYKKAFVHEALDAWAAQLAA
jgi:hypothetical protein